MAKVVKGVCLIVNPNIDKTEVDKVYVRYLVGLTDDSDMKAYKEIEMELSTENLVAIEALLAVALSQADNNEGL
jgi:hypothetical protein